MILGDDLPTVGDVVVGSGPQIGKAESLPEPESVPNVVSGEVGVSSGNRGPETSIIPVGGLHLHIPVPNSDDERENGGDVLFGGVCDFEVGVGSQFWEVDVTVTRKRTGNLCHLDGMCFKLPMSQRMK